MSNTPIVKDYTWEEITYLPGTYQPLAQCNWLLIVLENAENSDKDPDDVLMYNTVNKKFTLLPSAHNWHKYKFIQCGLELRLV